MSPLRFFRPGVGWEARALVLLALSTACINDDPPTGPQIPVPGGAGRSWIHGHGTGGSGVAVIGRSGGGLDGNRVTPSDEGGYVTQVDGLRPPFYLIDRANDWGSFAIDTGVANVSWLTLLQATMLIRTSDQSFRQMLYGEAGSPRADLPVLDLVTRAGLDSAQADAVSLLSEDYGIDLGPAADLDWGTTPFLQVEGDPIWDAINQTITAISDQGVDLFGELSREFTYCSAEEIVVAVPAGRRFICPRIKETSIDPGDPDVGIYRFITGRGDTLTATARGADVLTIDYVRARDGGSFSCAGSACGNVSIDGLPTDTLRALNFNGATLTGSGSAVLRGAFSTPDPTWQPPVAVCPETKYVARKPDGTFRQGCLVATAPAQAYGGTLRYETSLSFNGFTYPLFAVILARGNILLSVTQKDEAEGTVYYCAAAACNDVQLLPADPDGKRTILFDRLLLRSVDETGTANDVDSTVVKAVIRTLPPTLVPETPDAGICAVSPDTVLVSFSDGSPDWRVCVGANVGNTIIYRSWNDPDDNRRGVNLGGTGSLGVGTSSLDDLTITAVDFALPFGPEVWNCRDACPGVTMSLPDSNNMLDVTFDHVELITQGPYGLPGSRTVTVTGTVRNIPYFEGEGGVGLR